MSNKRHNYQSFVFKVVTNKPDPVCSENLLAVCSDFQHFTCINSCCYCGLLCNVGVSSWHMYIVNELNMCEQDTPGRPVPGSSFDDAGYMSEDENSWENISVVDTDGEEATANNGHQDTKKIDFKERFYIPDDILLLDRRDLPRMVSVVYGCDIDKVPAAMKEDVSKQNRQQEGRGRKGSGSNSSSRTGNLRRAAGQQ